MLKIMGLGALSPPPPPPRISVLPGVSRRGDGMTILRWVAPLSLLLLLGLLAFLALASSDAAQAQSATDYDPDNDGLIEVSSLAQLNAIRWDLNGDGMVDDGSDPGTTGTDAALYATAFPNPLTATATVTAMGCPTGDHDSDTNTPDAPGCTGYELIADLDFDENGDDTRNDTYNTGAGWLPIGSFVFSFSGTFEGNGHTISNLFINRSATDYVGLFGGGYGPLRNLGLADADVTGRERVGALVGTHNGTITASWATGSVTGSNYVGGLVGEHSFFGEIIASYAAVSVSATGTGFRAGGLVGATAGRKIIASYATGSVSGNESVGGLVGFHQLGDIRASYATGSVSGNENVGGLVGFRDDGTATDSYHDSQTTGRVFGIGNEDDGSHDNEDNNVVNADETNSLPGQTTAALRTPTAYGSGADIYANWNLDLDNADGDDSHATGQDDPWDFGANYNYPTLKITGGKQKGPGPVGGLSATANAQGHPELSWTAPTDPGDGTLTGKYAGRYSSDDGATWTPFTVTGTSHTITSLSASDAYRIQLWAIASGAAHTSSLRSSINHIPATDYDSDDDGLIEVSNLAQLNAIRWDLNGDGTADDGSDPGTTGTDAHAYAAAFPNPIAATATVTLMGCPTGDHDNNSNTPDAPGCTGYELTVDLDFDENGDDNRNDTYNTGAGWSPIGERFGAVFDGNGHTIANLFINRSGTDDVGLFGIVSGAVRNLGLADVNVTGETGTGVLAGVLNRNSSISASWATGSVTGRDAVGGLVGEGGFNAEIIASYAAVSVSGVYDPVDGDGGEHVGGLVGALRGGSVHSSYATGSVDGDEDFGGLVGRTIQTTVSHSYHDSQTTGRVFGIGSDDNGSVPDADNNVVDAGETNSVPGQTTSALRTPTGYSGIYSHWNNDLDGDSAADDPWDFGADYNYPALKVDFNGDGIVTWQEFGVQRRPGAPVGLTVGIRQEDLGYYLLVVWSPPTDGNPATGYELRYSGDGGTSWVSWVDTYSSLAYAIVAFPLADEYVIEVRATNDAPHSPGPTASLTVPSAEIEDLDDVVTDYDTDNDGLIEVSTLARLDAIRHDLDGDGVPTATGQIAYHNAFTLPATGMGCPDGDHDDDSNTPDRPFCKGYELTADLDFDTGTTGERTDDDYYNRGAGWKPIGDESNGFTAAFAGNGHTISNMFIFRPTEAYTGLFGATSGTVHNVGLVNPVVYAGTGTGTLVGQLRGGTVRDVFAAGPDAFVNASSGGGLFGEVGPESSHTTHISASWASVNVATASGTGTYGGMIGILRNGSSITAGYATGTMMFGGNFESLGARRGGLVGSLEDTATITASYSIGSIFVLDPVLDPNYGGLVGSVSGTSTTVTNSYWATDTSGTSVSAAGTGQTTSALRTPTAYGSGADIYAGWDLDLDNADGDYSHATGGDDPWDFGASYNYPALKVDFNGDGTATYREFGVQRRPGPPAMLLANPGLDASNDAILAVTWNAPTDGNRATGYQYRYSSDGGAIWDPSWPAAETDANWLDADTRNFTIPAPLADQYEIEVRAVNASLHSPGPVGRIVIHSIDFDTDNDGLIEVSNLAQLNAIRHDMNGDGMVDDGSDPGTTGTDAALYAAAFPDPLTATATVTAMGCPTGDHDSDTNTPDAPGCTGYELIADLDFDENDDGSITSADAAYWDSGAGWLPIGDHGNDASRDTYTGTFDGNGHTIANLYVDRGSYDLAGLFDGIGSGGVVRDLGLPGADVTGDANAGALSGDSGGTVLRSWFHGQRGKRRRQRRRPGGPQQRRRPDRRELDGGDRHRRRRQHRRPGGKQPGDRTGQLRRGPGGRRQQRRGGRPGGPQQRGHHPGQLRHRTGVRPGLCGRPGGAQRPVRLHHRLLRHGRRQQVRQRRRRPGRV